MDPLTWILLLLHAPPAYSRSLCQCNMMMMMMPPTPPQPPPSCPHLASPHCPDMLKLIIPDVDEHVVQVGAVGPARGLGHRGVGRGTEEWAGAQRSGQGHRGVGRGTEEWAGAQSGQGHRGVGRGTEEWAGAQRSGQGPHVCNHRLRPALICPLSSPPQSHTSPVTPLTQSHTCASLTLLISPSVPHPPFPQLPPRDTPLSHANPPPRYPPLSPTPVPARPCSSPPQSHTSASLRPARQPAHTQSPPPPHTHTRAHTYIRKLVGPGRQLVGPGRQLVVSSKVIPLVPTYWGS